MAAPRFESFEQLLSWLAAQGIETHSWGTGVYKSAENLWDEYRVGDITFQEDPPLRVVQVVRVAVEQEGAFLVEKEQVLSSGERRSRNQPPSEKMKTGESILEAAGRCLQEEVGVGADQILSVQVQKAYVRKIGESPSYPGLATQYTIHEAVARVRGLPAHEFWRDNKANAQGDPVSRHLWEWVTQA